MTTLQADTAYWQSGLWLALVGIGSGMFNSPNTAAMMGTVPAERRGIAAGARTMLQNTGAVISIAFVLAIVTAAVPKPVLFKIFSGLASGLTSAQLDPFIHNMHTALWVLAATSVIGAGVSLLRPRSDVAADVRRRRRWPSRRRSARRSRRRHERHRRPSCGSARSRSWPGRRRGRSATTRRSACCPRPATASPAPTAPTPRRDVERLTELLRLKDLLGVSLEELKELVEAEDARAALRREWQSGVEDPVRRREILDESLGHIGRQLELVRRRRDEIATLEAELLGEAQAGRRAETRASLTRSPRSAQCGGAGGSGRLLLEVLAQHRHLALVVGAEVRAVEALGRGAASAPAPSLQTGWRCSTMKETSRARTSSAARLPWRSPAGS